MAKAAPWTKTEAQVRKRGEQKGLDTLVVLSLIHIYVSFMENQASWHGSAPHAEQYAVAMADLEKVGEALCQM